MVRPHDCAIFQEWEGTAGHPLHRNNFYIQPLEGADDWEVLFVRVCWEMKSVGFEYLQIFEEGKDVCWLLHFPHIDLEVSEATEEGTIRIVNEVS